MKKLLKPIGRFPFIPAVAFLKKNTLLFIMSLLTGMSFGQTIVYVDSAAAGANNGTSWVNAYRRLSDANVALMLNSATAFEVRVAKGTYYPTGAQNSTDRGRAFLIDGGSAMRRILGGYPTGGGTRNPALNRTTLNGEIGDAGIKTDNSYHIVIMNNNSAADDSLILDGFVIKNGYANDNSTLSYGGLNLTSNIAAAILVKTLNEKKTAIRNCSIDSNFCIESGPVYVSNSSPEISNTTFTANKASIGGAIYNNYGSPAISNCTFRSNEASSTGGAIWNNSTASGTVITNCTFNNNKARDAGGAIVNSSAAASISGCHFTGNEATNAGAGAGGGAVYNQVNSQLSFENCKFIENFSANNGGAMINESSTITLNSCSFSENTAHASVGAVLQKFSSITINNSSFSQNKAPYGSAGALYIFNAQAMLQGCSFTQNSTLSGSFGGSMVIEGSPNFLMKNCSVTNNSAYSGSGIYCMRNSTVTIANSLVAGNAGTNSVLYSGGDCQLKVYNTTFTRNSSHPDPAYGSLLYNIQGGSTEFANCIISGNTGGKVLYSETASPYEGGPVSVTNSIIQGGYAGSGNRDINPLFVSATNYRLQPCSPAIDKGNNNGISGILGTMDLDSNNRYNRTLDLGAYEYNNPQVSVNIYVDGSRPSGGNGLSWNTAYKTLSEAIRKTADCRSNDYNIHVAQGTYKPNSTTVDRDSAFVLSRGGIRIFGGYPAGGGTRNTVANATILSGDIGVIGNNNDNNHHIFVISNIPEPEDSIVVDGFTLMDGNANGSGAFTYNSETSYRNSGGAAFIWKVKNGKKTQLRDCYFIGNTASSMGGAIFNQDAGPYLSDCRFSNGSANYGGAIFNVGPDTLTIDNARFHGNLAHSGGSGGAIYNNPGTAKLLVSRTIFANNNASDGDGGAVSNEAGGEAIFSNSLFYKNNSLRNGAAIYTSGNKAWAINCTFAQNTNGSASLGVVAINSGSLLILNSIAKYNGSGGIRQTGGTYTQQYSYIEGQTSTANNNFDGNSGIPLFRDMNLDDYRLNVCSPLVNSASSGGSLIGLVGSLDLDELPRTQLGNVDMGAYENNSISYPGAPNIVSANTVAMAYQLVDAATAYGVDCNTLLATVTGDGLTTSVKGNTTAKVWIESQQPAQYVKRHYEITPANNASTATGKVTLYFTQPEFNDFNAVNVVKLPTGPFDITGIANLLIEKKPGSSSDGTGLPGTYPGAAMSINPPDGNIIWNGSRLRWEISFDVTGFSGFFVKTQMQALPLQLISFTGARQSNENKLQWKTAEEVNVSHFELERSSNGTDYIVIKNVAALNGNSQTYYYNDVVNYTGTMYYRLKMVDRDGTFTYSNIVRLSGNEEGFINIYPNPVAGKFSLSFSDHKLFNTEAVITDAKGSAVVRIRIMAQQQQTDISQLAGGIYYIRFANGETKKLIRQ